MIFDARTVARILGGEANGNSVSAPGPGHSPKDRSLSIRIDPAAPGGFVLTSFSSTDDWRTCRDYVLSRLGLEPWRPGSRNLRKPLVVINREPDAHKEKMKSIALDIWRQSVSPVGTIVEHYLREHRGLGLPTELAGEVIRFHGSLYLDKQTRLPGMVCLMRDIETNQPCGIHRTFLGRQTGNKVDRKMLGTAKGAAIKFDLDHSNTLTIGEGVETVLSAREAGHGITKSTLIAPLNQPCPGWLRFLNETTGNDSELIRFLQLWCAYCLTGVTREHALVFVYGAGGNGKSVFLNVITPILKDYAATATMEAFTASRSDRHSTEIAMLRGARLVTASETEQGRAWAEARIKQMTGGDPITARFMRQDNFTFVPQFKLMIVGNHRLTLQNVDEAARRRFNIVPFDRKPERPDRELEQKLMAEAPAIFQWMIEGCLDWQQHGLSQPDAVKAATESYFSEQDMIGQWIEDCCDVKIDRGPNFIWDRSSELFESWSEFAMKAGEPGGTQKAFGQALQKRSFEPYRQPGTGARGFRFIRLRPGAKQVWP